MVYNGATQCGAVTATAAAGSRTRDLPRIVNILAGTHNSKYSAFPLHFFCAFQYKAEVLASITQDQVVTDGCDKRKGAFSGSLFDHFF